MYTQAMSHASPVIDSHPELAQGRLSMTGHIGRSPRMREPMALEWAWLIRKLTKAILTVGQPS